MTHCDATRLAVSYAHTYREACRERDELASQVQPTAEALYHAVSVAGELDVATDDVLRGGLIEIIRRAREEGRAEGRRLALAEARALIAGQAQAAQAVADRLRQASEEP